VWYTFIFQFQRTNSREKLNIVDIILRNKKKTRKFAETFACMRAAATLARVLSIFPDAIIMIMKLQNLLKFLLLFRISFAHTFFHFPFKQSGGLFFISMNICSLYPLDFIFLITYLIFLFHSSCASCGISFGAALDCCV
jgi:hypothetical protein